MRKTILTILVCGFMVLGLTGCGKTKTYVDDEEIKYYVANEGIEYKGIEIIFNSKYEIKTKYDGYEVEIPFEIKNISNKTYDMYENGPFFDVYAPNGISVSTTNKGYLETFGQAKLKPNATITDIMRFNIEESGEYTFESKDGKIIISYNIELPYQK